MGGVGANERFPARNRKQSNAVLGVLILSALFTLKSASAPNPLDISVSPTGIIGTRVAVFEDDPPGYQLIDWEITNNGSDPVNILGEAAVAPVFLRGDRFDEVYKHEIVEDENGNEASFAGELAAFDTVHVATLWYYRDTHPRGDLDFGVWRVELLVYADTIPSTEQKPFTGTQIVQVFDIPEPSVGLLLLGGMAALRRYRGRTQRS